MSGLLITKLANWINRTPEQVALCDAYRQISWEVLGLEARALAHRLVECGAGHGKLVAVVGPRNLEIVIGLVAVMFSGATYTIIEVADQQEEATARLAQIGADLVIATGGYGLECDNVVRYHFSASQAPVPSITLPCTADAAAYVLYTSGSTGTPKGVAVSHDNIAHYCRGITQVLGIRDGLRYAHVSTLAADLGNTGLFLALWTGGSLYVADDAERKDPQALCRLLSERNIDMLKITPTHWRTVLEQAGGGTTRRPELGWLLLGGEPLSAALARATLASGAVTQLFNHYGPTEATIGISVQAVEPGAWLDSLKGSVPMGRPLGETEIRIYNREGVHCAPGEVGELFIGGPQVALGYWKRSDLDAGRFVELDGRRFYRSGDQVRLDGEGQLQFVGRADRQVKVNGYRVELGHVEVVLQRILDARAVVVHHRYDERDYLLCAYEGVHQSAAQLRSELSKTLPGYMVPFRFDHLAKLPMNANGKLDIVAVEHQLLASFTAALADAAQAQPVGDNPSDKVRGIFQRHCRAMTVDATSDFFDLGGDSLDAVRLISELQLEGFDVTARAFLGNPTLNGLLDQLRCATQQTTDDTGSERETHPCKAGPAQEWFLQQDFREPNRWSQSILVEAGVRLYADRLQRACLQTLQAHELLRSRFCYDSIEHAWVFEAVPAYEHVFSCWEADAAVDDLAALLNQRYAALEQKLNVSAGTLFFVELIRAGGKQYLLLVAHHLAVDVVSWSLILDELTVRYVNDGQACPLRSLSYANWTRHLHEHQAQWAADAGWWHQRLSVTQPQAFEAGTEADAHTAWVSFSRSETAHISERAAAAGISIDQYLLGTYLQLASLHWPEPVLNVTVESHGRLSLSDEVDVSRTVGWFTAAFPVAVPASDLLHAPALVVGRALAQVPNLGHSYALSGLPSTATRHCFNYLGRARLGLRDDLQLRPAAVAYQGVRGRDNHRVNQFKLTGRLLEEQLILDLNFNARMSSPAQMQAFAQGLRHALLGADAQPAGIYLSSSSSSGALWNIPAQALPATTGFATDTPVNAPGTILLTGATGFIGVHILRELLEQSCATVHCLVRAPSQADAQQRLTEVWAHFFGHSQPLSAIERVRVIVGDMRQPRLGLAQIDWDHLASTVDAVYHFAADTRLVGSRVEMQRSIVAPAYELIRFVEAGKSKVLHFMSTLAVGGCYRGKLAARFDEDALDVGQDFLNEYERSKFLTEGIVRELAYRGHSAFIYRSGNVTGHSQTALFQRNADANRWVQCVNAIAHAGMVPVNYNEPLVLSPVDTVARGIVALSLDSSLPSGTYHVESPFSISPGLFVDALQKLGIPVARTVAGSLKEALERSGKTALAPVALGLFWASREPRNIIYDHSRTLSRLSAHGVEFTELSHDWVLRFVKRLSDLGLFRQAQPAAFNASVQRKEYSRT